MIVNVPETKTYNQCLALIQGHLRDIASTHGALKHWCEQEDLNYKAIIKIKNGSMTYYVPQMVLKLLMKFGYRASISRQYSEEEGTTEDLFIVVKTKDVKETGTPPTG